jgi:hypothetical protein
MKTLKKFQSKFNKDLKQKSQKQANYTHRLNRRFRRHYTSAFPLTECDKMCSPVKPMVKLKSSVHFNREHFFLNSDQLCSSVEPTQLKKIIGWSPTASSETEKIHSSVKPTVARGQHRFNRRYYFLSGSFFSNGSIGLDVYISAPNGFNSALSRLSTHHIHTLEFWEQQGT